MKCSLMKTGCEINNISKNFFKFSIASYLLSSAKHFRPYLTDAFKLGKKATDILYKRFVYNHHQLNPDPVELKRFLDNSLREKVFCQDEAIGKISEIISGMQDLWHESDITDVPCTSACTMTFMGDSGIGKTYAARALSQAVYHQDMQPWQFVTSTSVTSSHISYETYSELSPADQIFNKDSELVRQLKLNNKVIIVFDEIDKMHKIEKDDTILERLRDARDTGKLLVRSGVNYNYIDVSRTVFICITNESRECWGLPEEERTESQKESRTYVKRDKSLVNRFDVVEFKYFEVKDYMYMLNPMMESLKEYIKSYNLDLDIDETLIKQISVAAEHKNKGARGLNDYLTHLRGKLISYRDINEKSLKNEIHKLHVDYNENTDNFEVRRVEQ